eukprot:gene7167-8546_t
MKLISPAFMQFTQTKYCSIIITHREEVDSEEEVVMGVGWEVVAELAVDSEKAVHRNLD